MKKFNDKDEHMKIKYVDLDYPRQTNEVCVVNLCDVRAADGILVKYNYTLDGWDIYQPRYETDGATTWFKEAFLKSWKHENLTEE